MSLAKIHGILEVALPFFTVSMQTTVEFLFPEWSNFLSFRNCEQRYFLLLSFVRSHSFPTATDSSAAKWTILQESKGPSIVTCSPHWRPSGTRFKSHGLEQYSPRVPCLPADAVCRCRVCCCRDQIGAMTSDQIFIRTAHCKKVPRLNEICNHVEAKIFKNK